MNLNKDTITKWVDGYWDFIQKYHRNNMPLMINSSNMAKAHFHDEEGRGGYFAPESGTSEAQFLSIKGFLSVYCATKDTKWLDLAEDMMEAALQYLFPSAEVSDKFSKNNLWLPHWLYNASDPFTAERAFYDEEVHFLLGIGHLKTDRPRKIFSIRAAEAKLEWENIFSKVVGEAYEFKYLLAIKGFDIQLEKPFTGTLKVVYTCMGTDTIERNEQYEAWPHWRKLKEGENACAIDSLFWCYDCFDLLSKYSQRNRGKWSKAKEVMRESIAYALQVENLGDYIAKDFHNDNPFTQAGMYEWQNRSQAAVYTRNRKDGALQIQVPAGEGPVQFGNGSLDNAIGKSHTFKVCLKSDLTSDINVILATANEYSPETRYVASVHVNRSETAEEYELSISDFVKGLNWVPSYGVSGYYSPSSTVSSAVVMDKVDGKEKSVMRSLLTTGMEEEYDYSYAGWAQVAPNTNTGSFDTIPAIKYRSSGSIEIRLKDNKGWYWTRRLPETASYKTLKTNASEYTLQAYQENLGIKPSSIAFPVQEILFNASGSVGSTAVLYLSCIGDIEHYPYGTNVKNVIIEILDSRAQNMSFYYLRPFPLEEYQYAGSIATFSMSTMYNVVDTWRGTPYVGYQAPYFWLDCAEKEKLQTNLMFMGAAQDEYERRTGNSGFFAPVFIWDRWDSREYGTPNTFSWKGPDPNTNWGGFQYRAVEAAARTWYQAPDFPSAKRITMKFLSAVNSRWRSGTDPIFTTFNEDGTISSYGDEPQMTALLMRAALYAYEASANEKDTQSQAIAEALIEKCMLNLEKCYVEDGMIKGTWGDQDTWYSFWGGEILTTLSKVLSTEGSGDLVSKDDIIYFVNQYSKAYENGMSIGWQNISQASVDQLNATLIRFNITSKDEINHFLAQCFVESWYGNEKEGLTEINWRDYPDKSKDKDYFNNKYGDRKDLGNLGKNTDDGYNYRGAGYIHLTGRANYTDFATYVNDPKVLSIGAQHVADNYAWLVAGYYWENRVQYEFANGGTPTVSQVTYDVNGGQNNLTERTNAYNILSTIIK